MLWGLPHISSSPISLSLVFTLEIGTKSRSYGISITDKFLTGLCQPWGLTGPNPCLHQLGFNPHALHPSMFSRPGEPETTSPSSSKYPSLSCLPCQSKTLREIAANTGVVSKLPSSFYLWKLHGCLRLSQVLRYC